MESPAGRTWFGKSPSPNTFPLGLTRKPTPIFQLAVLVTELRGKLGCRIPTIQPSAYAVISPSAAGVDLFPLPTSIAMKGPCASSVQFNALKPPPRKGTTSHDPGDRESTRLNSRH